MSATISGSKPSFPPRRPTEAPDMTDIAVFMILLTGAALLGGIVFLGIKRGPRG